jgi:hypothetical protein
VSSDRPERPVAVADGGQPADDADDEGYVHDPAAVEDESGASTDDDGYVHDPATLGDRPRRSGEPDTPAFEDVPTVGGEGLGRRGWVLLVAVVLAFFGAPAVIYLRPPGVPFEVALLVVPLLPAFGLGTIAVWALAGRKE